MIVEDDEEFQSLLSFAKEKEIPLLLDFGATWCKPCQGLKPTFHKLAISEEYSNYLLFLEIDVDQCPQAEKQYEENCGSCLQL